jgi:hypothetical protein
MVEILPEIEIPLVKGLTKFSSEGIAQYRKCYALPYLKNLFCQLHNYQKQSAVDNVDHFTTALPYLI